jgi:hypothetical protein
VQLHVFVTAKRRIVHDFSDAQVANKLRRCFGLATGELDGKRPVAVAASVVCELRPNAVTAAGP